ncbi:MAG: alcohol dehydrogenase catalytic domain-containing protein [Nitrosopumilus sp.]|nr:alcohol dehydrogenase catalytic domain-containing protein [Nitrosopumilus sp.]
MKAAYFDGRTLEYTDRPDPSGDTLVRVDLAGICGTDLEILDGYMKYRGIPGHEFVGTVASPGRLEGRRVAGEINAACGRCQSCAAGMGRHCPDRTVLGILGRDGAFAEYLSLPERNLHPVPDHVGDRQAVFIEPLAAAYEITEQVDLDPGWRAAVVGDGRLGQLVCRVLRLSCDDVTCIGRHPEKMAALGPGISTGTSAEGLAGAFDLVVEASGSRDGLQDALSLARPRGRVVLKSTVSGGTGADLTPAVINEITVTGSRCGVFRPAIEALASGAVDVDGLAGPEFALSGVSAAVRRAGDPDALKVFLRP